MQKKEKIVLLENNMCKISDVNALFVAQIYATLIIVDKNQNIVKSVLKEK